MRGKFRGEIGKMIENKRPRCKYTTKKGEQCKRSTSRSSDFCWLHSAIVSYRSQSIFLQIIFPVSLFLLGVIATVFVGYFFAPIEIKDYVWRRELRERIIIEGDHSVKVRDEKKASVYSHKLHDLGVNALQKGDFDAYQEAIWQLLRLYESCITVDWPNDPTTALVRNEVSDQTISLITANPLDWDHQFNQCLLVCRKLGDFSLAGTKAKVSDYNEGKFFSDILFTEGLDIMRRVIDSLYVKRDYDYAGLIFGTMEDVILAEGHRRLDQGYRICPKLGDNLVFTISGERMADEGRPPELGNLYKACHIISQTPQQLFKSFTEKAQYPKLHIRVAEVEKGQKEEVSTISEVVARFRYYHPALIFGYVSGVGEKQKVLDSLLFISNKKGQEAAECVKKLVWRERYPKEWRRKFS